LCTFLVIRLFEKEISSQFFILVAGEVGLDGLVSVEAKPAELRYMFSYFVSLQP
jgi:hypothetical protein